MDRIRILDKSNEYDQIDLEGAATDAVLLALGVPPPQEGTIWQGKVEEIEVCVLSRPGFLGNAFRLVVQQESTGRLTDLLQKAGAQRLSTHSYTVARVEYGKPGADFELTEAYTPLEVDLGHAISISKGCYTGQEVIARQINYDKITRHLVGLYLNSPAQNGLSISSEGSPVGHVTSAVVSPRYGPIALGVVRRPFDKPETILTVEGSDQVKAKVTKLPFRITRR
jgi:folate-binding protein YgfZ